MYTPDKYALKDDLIKSKTQYNHLGNRHKSQDPSNYKGADSLTTPSVIPLPLTRTVSLDIPHPLPDPETNRTHAIVSLLKHAISSGHFGIRPLLTHGNRVFMNAIANIDLYFFDWMFIIRSILAELHLALRLAIPSSLVRPLERIEKAVLSKPFHLSFLSREYSSNKVALLGPYRCRSMSAFATTSSAQEQGTQKQVDTSANQAFLPQNPPTSRHFACASGVRGRRQRNIDRLSAVVNAVKSQVHRSPNQPYEGGDMYLLKPQENRMHFLNGNSFSEKGMCDPALGYYDRLVRWQRHSRREVLLDAQISRIRQQLRDVTRCVGRLMTSPQQQRQVLLARPLIESYAVATSRVSDRINALLTTPSLCPPPQPLPKATSITLSNALIHRDPTKIIRRPQHASLQLVQSDPSLLYQRVATIARNIAKSMTNPIKGSMTPDLSRTRMAYLKHLTQITRSRLHYMTSLHLERTLLNALRHRVGTNIYGAHNFRSPGRFLPACCHGKKGKLFSTVMLPKVLVSVFSRSGSYRHLKFGHHPIYRRLATHKLKAWLSNLDPMTRHVDVISLLVCLTTDPSSTSTLSPYRSTSPCVLRGSVTSTHLRSAMRHSLSTPLPPLTWHTYNMHRTYSMAQIRKEVAIQRRRYRHHPVWQVARLAIVSMTSLMFAATVPSLVLSAGILLLQPFHLIQWGLVTIVAESYWLTQSFLSLFGPSISNCLVDFAVPVLHSIILVPYFIWNVITCSPLDAAIPLLALTIAAQCYHVLFRRVSYPPSAFQGSYYEWVKRRLMFPLRWYSQLRNHFFPEALHDPGRIIERAQQRPFGGPTPFHNYDISPPDPNNKTLSPIHLGVKLAGRVTGTRRVLSPWRSFYLIVKYLLIILLLYNWRSLVPNISFETGLKIRSSFHKLNSSSPSEAFALLPETCRSGCLHVWRFINQTFAHHVSLLHESLHGKLSIVQSIVRFLVKHRDSDNIFIVLLVRSLQPLVDRLDRPLGTNGRLPEQWFLETQAVIWRPLLIRVARHIADTWNSSVFMRTLGDAVESYVSLGVSAVDELGRIRLRIRTKLGRKEQERIFFPYSTMLNRRNAQTVSSLIRRKNQNQEDDAEDYVETVPFRIIYREDNKQASKTNPSIGDA